MIRRPYWIEDAISDARQDARMSGYRMGAKLAAWREIDAARKRSSEIKGHTILSIRDDIVGMDAPIRIHDPAAADKVGDALAVLSDEDALLARMLSQGKTLTAVGKILGLRQPTMSKRCDRLAHRLLHVKEALSC